MSKYHGAFVEYTKLVQEMDSIYGGPKYNNKKQPQGRQSLLHIFEYLSVHRSSTCEDIASYTIRRREKSKLKVKSVTDDIRKFILNNLLPRKLVKEDGFKKKYNKKIQAYSLDHNGMLYAIHLLSKNKYHDNYPSNITYDESIIRNLAVEYSGYLPFVFDRLSTFKQILGEHWLEYLKIHEIAANGLNITDKLQYGPWFPDDFLNNFINRSAFVLLTSDSATENFASLDAWYNHKKYSKSWTNLQHHMKISDPRGISIMLLIYNNILGKLFYDIWKRHNVADENPEEIRKTITDQCMKIFAGEQVLWNWYWMFVRDAIHAMKKDMKKLENFSCLIGISM